MKSVSSRPNLAVLMPLVFGLRNVVHTGIVERLANAGVAVHLLLREFDPCLLDRLEYADFRPATSCQALLLPPRKWTVKGRSFLRAVIGSAFGRRNHIGSYPVYRRWKERNYTSGQRLKAQIEECLGTLVQPAPIFFRLYSFYNTLYRLEYDLAPVREQLQALAPALVWSTVNVDSSFERAYVLAARDLQIPIVNSILSFDNLTSKPAHLVYDYYLVWNQRMKDQLLQFYPQVTGNQVTITGTPQFDFHRRPEFLWSREETLACLGLPFKASYFLYATGHHTLTPAEPTLVASLAKRMCEDDMLKDYWLVVRTHPLDDWDRWNGIVDSSDRLVLSPAWDTTPNAEGWALSTHDDQARLVSTLAHTEACLNIASTITLDAAILDRPVIGIRFEHEHDAPGEILYEEYDADHYRPLVESGGLRLAHTWTELMDLMRQAISRPEQDREARARMVAQECGVVDGRAAERVANTLLDCLMKTEKGSLMEYA